MIRRYNLRQTSMAFLCLLGGVICCALTWLFFRYVPAYAAWQFGFNWSSETANGVAILCLAAVFFSGYRTWRTGGGLRGYHESAFYHDLGEETAGAMVVDHYVHRITGSAHALSQLFLASPLLLLRMGTLVASRLPDNSRLESKLMDTLAVLRTANKWQAITDYPERTTDILHLARMGLIDFSSAKGVPRIKADRGGESFTV
ncbi:MAG: hypothetical protein V4689_17220 [Verrucomicrobiota bacterium]